MFRVCFICFSTISCYKTIIISTLLSLNKQQNYHICLRIENFEMRRKMHLFTCFVQKYSCLHVCFISSLIDFIVFIRSDVIVFFSLFLNESLSTLKKYSEKYASCAYVVNLFTVIYKNVFLYFVSSLFWSICNS